MIHASESYGHDPSIEQLTDWKKLVDLMPGACFAYDQADQVGLSQGRQSEVHVVREIHGDMILHSLIWKRMAVSKGLSPDEAATLQSELVPYCAALESAGWRLPMVYATQVSEYAGGFRIVSVEQHILGGDGEQQLKDPDVSNDRKWALMKKVVQTLLNPPTDADISRQEIAGKELTVLPCGYDLKPANVVMQAGSDQLYAIDIFGPKRLDQAGNWRTYSPKLDSLPPENLRAVTATREGMLLRFWRMSEAYWRGGEQTVAERQELFTSLLSPAGMPQEEIGFIEDEISQGYPWLDEIYSERLV